VEHMEYHSAGKVMPAPASSVHGPVPVLDAASLSSVIAEEPLVSAQGGSTPMDIANISADQVSSSVLQLQPF
jgi:hypothetical protein